MQQLQVVCSMSALGSELAPHAEHVAADRQEQRCKQAVQGPPELHQLTLGFHACDARHHRHHDVPAEAPQCACLCRQQACTQQCGAFLGRSPSYCMAQCLKQWRRPLAATKLRQLWGWSRLQQPLSCSHTGDVQKTDIAVLPLKRTMLPAASQVSSPAGDSMQRLKAYRGA